MVTLWGVSIARLQLSLRPLCFASVMMSLSHYFSVLSVLNFQLFSKCDPNPLFEGETYKLARSLMLCWHPCHGPTIRIFATFWSLQHSLSFYFLIFYCQDSPDLVLVFSTCIYILLCRDNFFLLKSSCLWMVNKK